MKVEEKTEMMTGGRRVLAASMAVALARLAETPREQEEQKRVEQTPDATETKPVRPANVSRQVWRAQQRRKAK